MPVNVCSPTSLSASECWFEETISRARMQGNQCVIRLLDVLTGPVLKAIQDLSIEERKSHCSCNMEVSVSKCNSGGVPISPLGVPE